jgi:SSS family solute:Na+ symporter
LLGSAIIGFWYWCTDQYIVQRVLSAPNQKQARRGTIFAGYLKLLPVFIFLVPGMIAFSLRQKGMLVMDDPDQAFPLLVSTLLPAGVKGIVVGGLVAALMSSLASLFNSSAMLFTVDFYKKFKPDSSERHLVFVGRTATAVIVVLGMVWIPVMESLGAVLYEYLQDVQSLLAPGIAAVFIMGVFWKGATAAGGLWGLLVGFVLGMFRLAMRVMTNRVIVPEELRGDFGAMANWIQMKAANPEGLTAWQTFSVKFVDFNWLHYCELLLAICLGVIFIVSLFTKKPRPEQLQGLTYGSATPEQIRETRESWNKWDVIHTAIILGVVVAFYIYFW